MDNKTIKRLYILSIFSAIFIIFFLAANFDWRSLQRLICGSSASTPSETFSIPNYWLSKYGIILESEEDLQKDQDNDNLALLDEYKYFTNPKEADTDQDGYNDGKEVSAGYNPAGLGKLDKDQDNLPDTWEEANRLSLEKNDYSLDPDQDSLPNYLEFRHGTDPQKFDTDGDGYGDSSEIRNGYDPSYPSDARPSYSLKIEKIKTSAPLIWSKSGLEADLQEDLKNGIIHYPQTAVPGQIGNVVATGHSSNYAWAEGKYNYIFKDLNDLEKGDQIIISAIQKNGKVLEYIYQVNSKEIVAPDDQRIFEESARQGLTLITCWPLNTNWKRLMIQAEQLK